MKIGKLYKSAYLKAADLDDDTTVTIEEIRIEEINGDTKPVVYFEGFEQGLVLNKTNANTIAQVLGDDDTDNWVGGRVTLFVTQVDFQGKSTEAIRVKARAPKAATATAAAPGAAPRRRNADDDPLPF